MSGQKDIPISLARGEGPSSPHVLDLRAYGERGRERAEKENVKEAMNKPQLGPQDMPWLSAATGEENWMKQQYQSPRVLEHRPRSFHVWRGAKGGAWKHPIKFNFHRTAARPPEEMIAEITEEGVGLRGGLAKAGKWFGNVIWYSALFSWRTVRWVGRFARSPRTIFSTPVADPTDRYGVNAARESSTPLSRRELRSSAGLPPVKLPRRAFETNSSEQSLLEEREEKEEEWDDTPVVIWRRAEVLALIGLTLGVLITVKVASSFDSWKSTRGVVLGEAAEGVKALVAAHDAFNRADMPQAVDHFLIAEERFAHVAQAVEGNALASVLGRIPPFKSGLGLVRLGERSAQAAEHLLLGLKSLDEARIAFAQPLSLTAATIREGGVRPALFALPMAPLQRAVEELRKGEEEFSDAQVAAAAVDEEDVPEEYRPAVASLKAVLPPAGRLLRQARVGAELLISFFGAEQPRRFLVVFQNDAELRPTGGFMGSFAMVDADQGRITSLTIPGGGFYGLKGSLTARVDAPYPFHLFSPHWQAWNANWFFDFPSSARTIAWFIEKSSGPTVDGVITVTPSILEQILVLTGPVALPQYNAIIDGRNVRRVLQDETEQNYDRVENKPKQIIADLVPVIIQRIPEALSEKPGDTLAFIAQALDRHDILLWSSLPDEQARIEDAGWGGQVAAPQGDYLAVVHTNVGGGKTDRVFTEAWVRTLALTSEGDGVAKLEITRTHHGDPDDVYEGAHHVDYVRIFAPAGSALIAASGFDAPDPALFKYDGTLATHPEVARTTLLQDDEKDGIRVTREHGLVSFGGWVMTKAGETSSVTLSYRVPKVVAKKGAVSFAIGGIPSRTNTYTLTIQRQPGAPEAVFTDTVLAPEGWGAAYGEQGIVGRSQELKIDRDTGYRRTWH